MALQSECLGERKVSAGMLFINSSSSDKASADTRKLIRSHVMQGRKKKRKRDARQSTQLVETTVIGADCRCNGLTYDLGDVVRLYTAPTSHGSNGRRGLIPRIQDTEPDILLGITQVSHVVMHIVFPLKAALGHAPKTGLELYSLANDVASLHITAFAIEGFIDTFLRGQQAVTSTAALLHLQRGLELLQQRLVGGDEEAKIQDSTLSAVMKLAGACHFVGDDRAARCHLEGLHRMLTLRGGLDELRGNEILFEILRCDLGIALLDCAAPIVLRGKLAKEVSLPLSLLDPSRDKLLPGDGLCHIRHELDSDLDKLWQVMRRFCLVVNLAASTQSTIRLDLMQETMTSILYQLLQRRSHETKTCTRLTEAVQLGLMVLCYHLFIQWKGVRSVGSALERHLRQFLEQDDVFDEIPADLSLWLLTVSAVSIFDLGKEEHLRKRFQGLVSRCSVKTWAELREGLRRFIWVSLLDDEEGQRVFDSTYVDLE